MSTESLDPGRGEIPEDDAEALYELSGGNMDKLTELRRTYLWTIGCMSSDF